MTIGSISGHLVREIKRRCRTSAGCTSPTHMQVENNRSQYDSGDATSPALTYEDPQVRLARHCHDPVTSSPFTQFVGSKHRSWSLGADSIGPLLERASVVSGAFGMIPIQ